MKFDNFWHRFRPSFFDLENYTEKTLKNYKKTKSELDAATLREMEEEVESELEKSREFWNNSINKVHRIAGFAFSGSLQCNKSLSTLSELANNQAERDTEVSDFFESQKSKTQKFTSQVHELENVTRSLKTDLENERERIDRLSHETESLVLPEMEKRTIDLLNITAINTLTVSTLQPGV